MRLDDSGLLTALHEGMFQQPLWQDFLERLRQRTGAVYTTLVFRPIDEDAIVAIPFPIAICAKGGSMRSPN